MLQPINCEKCGNVIRIEGSGVTIRCNECGATYQMKDNDISGEVVERTYDFLEFRCIYKTYSEQCENKCLAPEMYCEEHLKDEDFESARNSISYTHNRVKVAEKALERMKESKKVWLIQKVSGIDG